MGCGASSSSFDPAEQEQREFESGVSLKFLFDFASVVPYGMTTAAVVSTIIAPKTKSKACRFIDLVEHAYIGPPAFYISHRWGGTFQYLVECLQKYFHKDSTDTSLLTTYVWLDIFAINQHAHKMKSSLPSLSRVLGRVSKTLLCLDKDGGALSRIWCLYELWSTVQQQGVEHVQLLAYDLRWENLREFAYLPNNERAQVMHQLDITSAQATEESDKAHLLEVMTASIGPEELNAHLKDSLVGAAAYEGEQAQLRSSQDPEGAASALYKHATMLQLAGRGEEAFLMMERAVQLATEKLGTSALRTLEVKGGLALMLQDLGKVEEAEHVMRDVVLVHEARAGPRDQALSTALSNLASVVYMQGRPEEALELLRRALDITQSQPLPAPTTLMVRFNSVGLVCQGLGELSSAEDAYSQALVIAGGLGRSAWSDQATIMSNLGMVRALMGKYEDADHMLKKCLEMTKLVYGERHPEVANVLGCMGLSMMEQSRWAEARPLFESALDIDKATLGLEHRLPLSRMSNLAMICTQLGDFSVAEAKFKQVLDIQMKNLGQVHEDTIGTRQQMAELMLQRGQVQQAEATARQALQDARGLSGDKGTETVVEGLRVLAVILLTAKKLPEAESCLRDAMAGRSQLEGEESVGLLELLVLLQQLLEKQERLEEAAGVATRIQTIQADAEFEEESAEAHESQLVHDSVNTILNKSDVRDEMAGHGRRRRYEAPAP